MAEDKPAARNSQAEKPESKPPESMPPMSRRSKQSGLYRNWVSYVGALLTSVGVFVVLLLILLSFTIKESPYIGIFTYMIFPAIVLAGVAIVLLGMWLESRRRLRSGATEARAYPTFDFNNPRHRRRLQIGLPIATVVGVMLTYTGYEGFLLTESVEFCGKTCHTQMGPEMTAYQGSPHARVRCVDCHVGSGAGFYVQSKVNGVSQLTGVMFGTYDRPIPTPVKGLRPARETCEECHWQQKFWGSQLYQRAHFQYDEKNTPNQLTMLMKTGGGGENGAGIHWHMMVENEVTYAARDKHLQDIPWVKVKRRDGSVTEYTTTDKAFDPSTLPGLEHRTMDCMDCHNRPAHVFEPPDIAVDRALSTNVMTPTLPWAKSLGVDSLAKEYATREAAHEGIKKDVNDFYAQKYPEVSTNRRVDIDKMIAALLAIYDRNVFPEMKVSWATYLTNNGHRNSAGCFRCHDGKHVTPDGKILISECKACHTTPQRGPQSGMGEAMTGAEKDWHPWQIPQKHLEIKEHANIQCYECHLAGRRPKTECNECHSH